MQTEEFIAISPESILNLLRDRYGYNEAGHTDQRRQRPRWPFPGTAELWIPNEQGEEQCVLARALNLNPDGVGILIDSEVTPGAKLSIAIHQPEVTFYGQATVRHCRAIEQGYHAGLSFVYD